VPRIELFDPSDMTPEQQSVYDAVIAGPRGTIVGPLRAVMRLPAMADLWQRFGAHIRYALGIPKRASELAILVVARHWSSQVEWQMHTRAARAAGIEDAIIEAIRIGTRPDLQPSDAAVYDFAEQLTAQGDIADAVHAAIVALWGEDGVVELTAVIGYYTMVAFMLNAQGIPRQATDEPMLQPLVQASPAA